MFLNNESFIQITTLKTFGKPFTPKAGKTTLLALLPIIPTESLSTDLTLSVDIQRAYCNSHQRKSRQCCKLLTEKMSQPQH